MIKIKKTLLGIVNVVLSLVLMISMFTACFGGGTITFVGSTLKKGQVGVEYSQSIATATGVDGISYALKSGDALPAGLTLKNGTVSGVPSEKADAKTFTVVASAEGATSVEAQFTITIEEGTLTYTGSSDLQVPANTKGEVSVATATGADMIKYALKGGSTLPAGLTFATDGSGLISGTATTPNESVTFTVVASAVGCKSAEAQFTLTVVQPWLTYEGVILSNGRVGEYYSASVATATGTLEKITYALKEGSVLPAGLTVSESGLVMGTPTEKMARQKFIVVASAEGYTSAEAEFTVTVLAGQQAEADPGTITYRDKTLKDAYVNESYEALKAVAGASTDNRQTVTYTLKSDDALPEGLTLLPDGTLSGTPTKAGEVKFTVVASAPGCANVEKEFTMNVLLPRIIFESLTMDLATLEEVYEYSIASASVLGGAKPTFTYAVKEGATVPAGLSLSADGIVSGTPNKMVKNAYFGVVVSADGYTSTTANIYITVQDKIHTGVTRFEAEYWDFTGLTGGGYSGSATEEQMIQDGSSFGASNDRYVGYTHSPLKFTVTFNSDKAVTGAKFSMGLDTELDTITLTDKEFRITLNGKSIGYSIVIEGNPDGFSSFRNFVISEGVDLLEGENVIVFEVLENTLLGGARTGGPGIDYFEFANLGGASLSWRPKSINLL